MAYLRDSGHEDQELSIEQQEIAIRTWCAERGLILAHIYRDEAAPGSSTIGRDQFLAMINHFREPDCPNVGLVLWKYNRFARDIDDAQFYRADLRRRGYIIHSLNDPIPDGLDGRFFETAIDWMNARFLEDLRVDIKRGLHHNFEQYGAIGGTPPPGFKREEFQIGTRRDGRPRVVARWVPDPETIPLVRLAFQMRVEGKTLREIQTVTQFYRNINGWIRFFGNRIYLGELRLGDRINPNYCDPIIDQDTWDRVQLITATRARPRAAKATDNPRRIASNYLLSGLLFCPRCGSPYSGNSFIFKANPARRGEYYRCSGIRFGCSAPQMPRALVEEAVISAILEQILDTQTLMTNYQMGVSGQASRSQENDQKRQAIRRQIDGLQRKIDNLVEAIADQGRAAPRAISQKLSELENDLARLKTEHRQLTPTLNTKPLAEEDLQQAAELVRETLLSGTFDELRTILQAIVDRIVVERDGHNIRGQVIYSLPEDVWRSVLCPKRESERLPVILLDHLEININFFIDNQVHVRTKPTRKYNN